jgi:hypothetical protein
MYAQSNLGALSKTSVYQTVPLKMVLLGPGDFVERLKCYPGSINLPRIHKHTSTVSQLVSS